MATKKRARRRRNYCGARNRMGLPCRMLAMANGRCRIHGGKSTGPPKGSQNGLTHGLYASGLFKHERERYHAVPLGSLDDELRMAKIKLARAYEAQKRWEEQRASGTADGLDVEGVEETVQQGQTPTGQKYASMTRRTIKRKVDFTGEIVTLTRLVASLEARRAELRTRSGDEEFVGSVAEKLREFTAQAEASVPEVET